jgi:hypothetical protein
LNHLMWIFSIIFLFVLFLWFGISDCRKFLNVWFI